MDINYITLIGAAVLSMIIGGIWFGPIFGKKWIELMGGTETDMVQQKKIKRASMQIYGIQFALSLVQVYVLGNLISWTGGNGMGIAFWMWLGFVMPTVAGSALWNNNPNHVKWTLFLLQSSYQLIVFLIYGYVLGMWG